MDRRLTAGLALALWVLAFGGAFLAYAWTAPSDMGFTRGLNRVGTFLAWQGVAALAAIAAFVLAGPLAPGLLRRLARAPLWLMAGLALAALAVLGWAIVTA